MPEKFLRPDFLPPEAELNPLNFRGQRLVEGENLTELFDTTGDTTAFGKNHIVQELEFPGEKWWPDGFVLKQNLYYRAPWGTDQDDFWLNEMRFKAQQESESEQQVADYFRDGLPYFVVPNKYVISLLESGTEIGLYKIQPKIVSNKYNPLELLSLMGQVRELFTGFGEAPVMSSTYVSQMQEKLPAIVFDFTDEEKTNLVKELRIFIEKMPDLPLKLGDSFEVDFHPNNLILHGSHIFLIDVDYYSILAEYDIEELVQRATYQTQFWTEVANYLESTIGVR